jgi:hypothetical protein
MDEIYVHSKEVIPVFAGLFAVLFCLVLLVVLIIKTWIFCRIFSKAGFSWALGLLMLIPIVNIIMPFVLALCDWPIHKELRGLKQQQSNLQADTK